MRTLHIPVAPDHQRGSWQSTVEIATRVAGELRRSRYLLYYVDATGSCRRTFGGPILSGPYAYAVRRYTEIPALGTLVHQVDVGQHIEMAGHIFLVDVEDDQLVLQYLEQRVGASI